MNFKTITKVSELKSALSGLTFPVAVDVETAFDAVLLGVAVCFDPEAPFYVALNQWDPIAEKMNRVGEAGLEALLAEALAQPLLIGWNVEYDRAWIDRSLGVKSKWTDARLAWFLSDAEQTIRGYGLKDAQRVLLGWETSNEVDFYAHLRERGAKPAKGEKLGKYVYMGALPNLSKYACLDVVATLLCWEKVQSFFIENDYHWFLERTERYQELLARDTARGVCANKETLVHATNLFAARVQTSTAKVREVCYREIAEIESEWFKKRVSGMKMSHAISKFAADAHRHKRFNPNSAQQRAHLFHEKLKFPVLELTDGGRPKTSRSVIAQINHPAAEVFVEISENSALHRLTNSLAESVKPDGRLHFPYDAAGTVTGRLGGFKPYALNLPFDAKETMDGLFVSPGFEGIHADLKSIEPLFIAALSQDETLLKVHRDGLGDVYLDFALVAFPNDFNLRRLYNPLAPCTEHVKEALKKVRKACKIVHLAVGYTGTASTVSKSLTAAGFPTTEAEAQVLVFKYWELFWRVKELDAKLKKMYDLKGSIRNAFGRIIQVPRAFRKDIFNRVVQSSAHDALVEWVFAIQAEVDKRQIQMYSLLRDTHDSTTWEVEAGRWVEAREIYTTTLRDLSSRLSLGVNLDCEIKRFTSFYGLKNRE